MKWEDTVMDDIAIQSLEGRCNLPSTDYDRQVVRTQAEISFKAGIKEVVEWIDSQWKNYPVSNFVIAHEAWHYKLKEWGIDD